jgi:hypothetical protein
MKNIKYKISGGGVFSRVLQGGIQALCDNNIEFDNIYLSLKPFPKHILKELKISLSDKNYEFYEGGLNCVIDQKIDDSYTIVDSILAGYCKKIENHVNLQRYRVLAKKLSIRQSILDKIDEKLNGIDLDKTLGVHVRLTTMNRYYTRTVTIEDYINHIDKLIEQFKYEKICVASDNHQSLRALIDKYGDMILYNENFIRLDTDNIESLESEATNFFTERHWIEAFTDCIFISRCSSLLCQNSNFANMAIVFGNQSNVHRISGKLKT